MKYNYNMSTIQESGNFELIPEGIQYAKITEVVEGQTRDNKDPMASIKLTIASGLSQDQWLWDNIVMPLPSSPAIKILSRTKRFLHALGLPYEGEISGDTKQWLWRPVTIRVKHEEYKGKVRPKVSEYVIEDDLNNAPIDEPEL